MAVALFIVAAATSHSQPTAHSYWFSCRESERIHCIAHEMRLHHRTPVGFWQHCARRCTVYPYWKRHVKPVVRKAYRQMTRAVRGYTVPMLVTFYLATGSRMANGIYPSVGWAACGYDLPLGARVSVPGVGVLTCGDRIGFQPWRHIDVFGVALGTGYRRVTVLE